VVERKLDSKTIALSSLFAVLISIQKVLFPPIYDKMISIVIQVTLLSLAFFILGFKGPIITGILSGLLTSFFRSGYALMTFSFSALYGLIISFFHLKMQVIGEGSTNLRRTVISCVLASILIGVSSASTAVILGLFPPNMALILLILFLGIVEGSFGAFFSVKIWNKYSHIFLQFTEN
jgi:hypothetical protein